MIQLHAYVPFRSAYRLPSVRSDHALQDVLDARKSRALVLDVQPAVGVAAVVTGIMATGDGAVR